MTEFGDDSWSWAVCRDARRSCRIESGTADDLNRCDEAGPTMRRRAVSSFEQAQREMKRTETKRVATEYEVHLIEPSAPCST
jgi:hypothetical protein